MKEKNREKKPVGRVAKTVRTVLLVLLAVVLVALAILGYRYRSHIKAAVIWLTASDDDIQKNIDKAKETQTQVLTDSGFNASKELGDALSEGKITAEEHTQILLGNVSLEEVLAQKDTSVEQPPEKPPGDNTTEQDTQKDEATLPNIEEKDDKDSGTDITQDTAQKVPDKKEEQPKPAVPSAPEKTEPEKTEKPSSEQSSATTSDADKRIAELVTRMYVLKAEYTGAVEGVVASMKAEYVKLPPEQRTLSAKQSIATGYLGKINAMEAQCDAQVNAIVTEVRQILKENGRDTSLADAILSTYATEKENTKAYYLSTYGD